MPIRVKVFGDLRKKIKPNIKGSLPLKFNIDENDAERVSDILNKYNIKEHEIIHIFVNGRYSGLTKKVKDGDTVAIFPINMSVLYKWYFNREEDE
jgi:molybdopterin converting factor small subunit